MRTPSSFKSLLWLAAGAIILMSFVPLIVRWTSANEITIGIVRLAIGAAGLAVLQFFSRHKRSSLSLREWRWVFLIGFVFACHWYTYFKSIKLAGASLAAIGMATFGIHLLLLNSLILKDKLTKSDVFAVALALCGIYIVSPTIELTPEKWQGFLCAIFSGFLYAFLPLINRHVTHLPTNTRAFGQFGFALVLFLMFLPQANFDLAPQDWWSLAALGIFSTLIAHTLWLKASTELPPQMTSVIYYAYIPVTLILSYIFLDEPLTWQKLLGAGLIITANILAALLHKKSVALRTKGSKAN